MIDTYFFKKYNNVQFFLIDMSGFINEYGVVDGDI